MEASGLLFLSRTRPVATTAADGTFCLQLLAYDRIATHQTEGWRITWSGQEASDFWSAHRNSLIPGTAIQVQTHKPRAHAARGCTPEIHATVTAMSLVAVPSPAAAPASATRFPISQPAAA